jgi:NAD-dependent dihydropyrimidine dehydrogenase PreA subunit
VQFADNYTGRCVRFCPRNIFTYADMLSKACVAVCPDAQVVGGNVTYNRTFADDSTKTCVFTCPTNPWTYA